ncbi:MAG: glycosyl transferase, partial [Actinomyces sp.]|nr:glycosyl transferase [Actinomyces sp.]
MSERKSYSILMVNLPFSGHTNPTLGLARMLTDMGHRVTYVHSPTWREAVENTGARFVPYDDYPLFPSPFQDRMRCWRAAYRTVLRIGAEYDCLIYEMLFVSGKALADRLGIVPIRLFSTFALNEHVLEDFGRNGGLYLTSIFRFPRLRSLISAPMSRRYGWRFRELEAEIVRNSPALNITYTPRSFQVYANEFPQSRYAFVGASIDGRRHEPFEPPEGS